MPLKIKRSAGDFVILECLHDANGRALPPVQIHFDDNGEVHIDADDSILILRSESESPSPI